MSREKTMLTRVLTWALRDQSIIEFVWYISALVGNKRECHFIRKQKQNHVNYLRHCFGKIDLNWHLIARWAKRSVKGRKWAINADGSESTRKMSFWAKSALLKVIVASHSKFAKMSGWTGHLIFAVIVVGFGSSFQHGYGIGVINTPKELVDKWINETYHRRYDELPKESTIEFVFSVIVAIFSVGGMVGALMTSYVAERFGRKGGLLINNVFVFIAAILMGLCKTAKSYEMLIAGRFFIGINSGNFECQ